MNWLKRAAIDLHQVKTDDDRFETGRAVEFPYLRNKQKAPFLGEMYQQHIEPAGRYMVFNEMPGDRETETWEIGTAQFSNPLVIAFNSVPDAHSYDETSWKARLSRAYGGKTGLRLSKAIIKDGYDGIVTVYIDPNGKPRYTKEIVDLRPIIERLKR